MSLPTKHYTDLVYVEAGFKPSVQLPADFDNDDVNTRLIHSYIPTTQSVTIFTEIARSFNPNSAERARMLVGTFGTGKSDLLLMLCNYFSKPVDDPSMRPFYQRLESINDNQASVIKEQRASRPPFLVVLLQADAVTPFPGFVLHGLHQALAHQNLEHLMDKTKYQAARELIDTWERDAHPRLADLQSFLRDRENREIATLKAELDSGQADIVFPVFQRAFKAVTGTDFSIYGFSQPHEAYLRVAKTLREQGTHSGILLVCDEFTEFLRRFELGADMRELESETKTIENLAERSATSGSNQIHFLVASLESFASASVESSTAQANKAIERSGGRFKQHSLAIQGSEELLRGAIQRTEQGKQVTIPNRQRDELLSIGYDRWLPQGYKRDWVRDVIVNGTFPLHPLTTFALPLINRKVAQSQRTMFLFLNSDQGLRGFLKRTELSSSYEDWFNLVTLDYLFDYFYESIETKRPEIAEAFTQSVQRLRTATVDIRLAERVLKIVALSEVISDSFPGTTRLLLRQALNLPESAQDELLTALDMLENLEAIYPPSEMDNDTTGIYSLPMQGRVSSTNLKQRIKAIAQTLSTSVTRLQGKVPPEPVKAVTYNTNHGTHRELTAFYIPPEALSSSARLKSDLEQVQDGLLWYVIATSDMERAKAQSEARELTKKHANLVIAIPSMPLTVLSALRDYEALVQLRNDPQLDNAAKGYLKDEAQVGKSYKSALDTAIARLRDPKQWELFANGSNSGLPLPDLANSVIRQLFAETPVHHLGQHFKVKGNSAALDEAIEQIIKGNVLVDSKKSKATEMILRSAVVELGLLKLEGKNGAYDVYTLIEPGGTVPRSHKVWQLMRKHFANQKSWSDLITALRKPPYGMYDSLLNVFIASFLAFYAEAVEVVSTSTSVSQRSLNIDVSLIKKMIDQPHAYEIRYQPLDPTESQWLRGIVERGLKKGFDQNSTRGITLRTRVSEHIRQWIKRLDLPLFVETIDSSLLQQLYADTDAHQIQVALLLIQSKDVASDVLTSIPHTLGMPVDHSSWNNNIIDEGLEHFTATCKMVEELPTLLSEYASKRIASVFGAADVPSNARWIKIYQWRRNREVVQASGLSTYPRTLFRLANQPTGSIESALLDEFARTIVGVNLEYNRWSSVDKLDKVVEEITKAKEGIDELWKRAAPAEEVWLDGLAKAALGRTTSGIKSTTVAKYLAEWGQSISWPTWVQSISIAGLQALYPELSTQQCEDLTHILKRTGYDADTWEGELTDGLPKHFGVQSWRTDEIRGAIDRFTLALQQATNLDANARTYILSNILELFESDGDNPQEALRSWFSAHPILVENDVSMEARILLNQLRDGADNPSTLILTTLPRAFPQIGKSYQQWNDYITFAQYANTVNKAVREINSYVPAAKVEYEWLKGITSTVLKHPLDTDTHEQNRLVRLVYQKIIDWRGQQQLPTFVFTITEADLKGVLPDSDRRLVNAILLLLKTSDTDAASMTETLLVRLPVSLQAVNISEGNVGFLLAELTRACVVLSELPLLLRRHLYEEIKKVFNSSSEDLETDLRSWRDAHVLLPNDQLSSDSRALFSLLHANGNLARELLSRLPKDFRGIGAPYEQWKDWTLRDSYLTKLRAAVQEIEERGKVKDATPQAKQVWETFKQSIDTLNADERRWIINKFNQELRG